MNITIKNDIVAIEGLGALECGVNRFHSGHIYLRPRLERYDLAQSGPLFEELARRLGKPLQVMCGSGEKALIEFLERGGFVLRRRCFECEADRAVLDGAMVPPIPLLRCGTGEHAYEICCRLLYEKYKRDHAAVNPLTAALEEFSGGLPETVLCEEREGEIVHFAFVEGNELAYMGGGEQGFGRFVLAASALLLEEYESICFEADDCDRTAMAAKALLCPEATESWHTYVRRS